MDDLLDSAEMVGWPLHKHCHRSDEARELFKQSHTSLFHTHNQEENRRCEGKEMSEYDII